MSSIKSKPDYKADKGSILADYRLASLSRNLSIIGRREVLSGKAKFGIFGDGKEIVQLAMAKQFRNGDWRSGYYRDQTWMMAMGLYSAVEFFHQLYGNTDRNINTGSGGRVFNNHFSVPNINPDGSWRDLMKQKNSSSDISPTAGQMPRLLGLAYASKLFVRTVNFTGSPPSQIREMKSHLAPSAMPVHRKVISGKQ
jgi:TPP-dependent pyruvate/acetoin dehydrogenase alpha subunit